MINPTIRLTSIFISAILLVTPSMTGCTGEPATVEEGPVPKYADDPAEEPLGEASCELRYSAGQLACLAACAGAAGAGCAAVSAVCTAGTVWTCGGVSIPCSYAVIAACGAFA